MIRRLIAPIALVAFMMPGISAAAGDLAQAEKMISTVTESAVHEVVAANVTQEEKIARFRSMFSGYFDVPSIARFVIGRYWRGAPQVEQDRFITLFHEVNIYTWARRFNEYNGQKLVVTQVTPDGDKGAFVDTAILQDGNQPPFNVRWRLRERDDTEFGWQIVDIVIEGVSMAITYRSDYSSLLAANGGDLSKLNDMLTQRVAELKANQPS